MNAQAIKKIILHRMDSKKSISLTLQGNSMLPFLLPGDILTTSWAASYALGDILVYFYKNEGILAHRCVKVLKDGYYCKGDSAFRLEHVTADSIVGKVQSIKRNGKEICLNESDICIAGLSYEVGKEFVRIKYNSDRILNSDMYILLRNKCLQKAIEFWKEN